MQAIALEERSRAHWIGIRHHIDKHQPGNILPNFRIGQRG